MPEFWTKVSELDVPVYLPPREPLPSQRRSDNTDEEMNKALRRCRASFFRSAYRFLNNEADAEDAVQDALLSAY
ncbi:MAG: sigma factor, partial [Candidatus Sulfotelmatobacter sp.]